VEGAGQQDSLLSAQYAISVVHRCFLLNRLSKTRKFKKKLLF